MNSSLFCQDQKARTRYNLYRAWLLVTTVTFAFFLPAALASPTQSQPASDVGTRYKVCFTATDTVNGYNISSTKCDYITVVGACTPATADVNIDGRVDILDMALVASHYGETRASPQAYNPLDTPIVGLDDLNCLAGFFGQADPLP